MDKEKREKIKSYVKEKIEKGDNIQELMKYYILNLQMNISAYKKEIKKLHQVEKKLKYGELPPYEKGRYKKFIYPRLKNKVEGIEEGIELYIEYLKALADFV